MAKFDIAFKLTLKHEGSYSNDENDPGGETYMGIAKRRQINWEGWKIIDSYKNKPHFPKSLNSDPVLFKFVKNLYKLNFWDAAKLDELNNQNISNEIFDTGVNQGIKTAIKYLQESLNILNRNQSDYKDIKVDVILGNITLSLVNNHKRDFNIIKCLNGLQFMRYYNLAKNNKKFERYLNGWLNRVF